MSEARLDIRADARELSTAARIMQRFGVTGARASRTIKREMRDLGKEIKILTADQKRLTAEMLKVEKGTDAYKKLAKQVGAVGDALKEAQKESKGLGQTLGRGTGRGGAGAMRRGASYARVTAQQMVGTLGTAGPEQTYGTMGQLAGGLGTALSNVPFIGAAFGLMGAVSQAGMNVMQRRSSMLISAQKARQSAGAFVRSGIGEESVIGMAESAAKRGYSVEEAYGIMRSFGQGAGYRAGIGTLEMQRMGFGPGAMSGASLYAAGMGGTGIGRGGSQLRGEAGKTLLRQVAAQARLEQRFLVGKGAERSITPTTVEQRLTEMVSYLKQMALEGVAIEPGVFQEETMRIFSLGLQTQNKELFAGGKAFRFQTAMREGQKGEGSMLNFMAVMSGMTGGKDLISAMEDARLGRVPLSQMQQTMRGMGVGQNRAFQYVFGKQTGVPMEEIAAFVQKDLSKLPPEYVGMARKGGGALNVWRGAAPVSPFQKKLMLIRAAEMKAAKGSVDEMLAVAKAMVGAQTDLAKVGTEAFNGLVTIVGKIHLVLSKLINGLEKLGIIGFTMTPVELESMKLPERGKKSFTTVEYRTPNDIPPQK